MVVSVIVICVSGATDFVPCENINIVPTSKTIFAIIAKFVYALVIFSVNFWAPICSAHIPNTRANVVNSNVELKLKNKSRHMLIKINDIMQFDSVEVAHFVNFLYHFNCVFVFVFSLLVGARI